MLNDTHGNTNQTNKTIFGGIQHLYNYIIINNNMAIIRNTLNFNHLFETIKQR